MKPPTNLTPLDHLLAEPETARWHRDVEQRAEAQADETRRWIVQLTDLCRRLAASTTTDPEAEGWLEVALFYIRLYSVVEELPAKLAAGRELRQKGAAALALELERVAQPQRELMGRLLFVLDEQHRCAVGIRDALTFKERVVLWLLRHYNCHLGIVKDGLKLTDKGEVSESRLIAEEEDKRSAET